MADRSSSDPRYSSAGLLLARRNMKYIVRYREVGSDRIGETTYSGPLSREGVIEFFGLGKADVEWYEVEEVKE